MDGCWVFGNMERDSKPPKCFFVTVSDRSAQTLIPLIKRWILPGTTIVSDCWKSYSSLASEGYIHDTINHSIQFVSVSGAHTNHTESRWNALFLETLRLIGSVYKPPDELLSRPAAAVAQPQAVADDSTGTTSVTSQSSCDQPLTTFSRAADIANFDLGF